LNHCLIYYARPMQHRSFLPLPHLLLNPKP
jgi:hypothetical protein